MSSRLGERALGEKSVIQNTWKFMEGISHHSHHSENLNYSHTIVQSTNSGPWWPSITPTHGWTEKVGTEPVHHCWIPRTRTSAKNLSWYPCDTYTLQISYVFSCQYRSPRPVYVASITILVCWGMRLKKRVVRIMDRISRLLGLWETISRWESVREFSHRESSSSYRALRIPNLTCFWSLRKGRCSSSWTMWSESVHSCGGTWMWGMRFCDIWA